MWSLFLPRRTDVEPPHNTSPFILFLLINLIIFLILISLHAQQHAASMSRKAARKRKRIAELAAAERLEHDHIKSPQPLLSNEPTLASTETEVKRAATDVTSCDETAETNSGFEASMAVSSSDCICTPPAAVSGCPLTSIEGSSANEEPPSAASMQTFPIQDTAATPAAIAEDGSEPCWTVDEDGRPAATVEKIVLEEDGRLRLIELSEGPDASGQDDQRLGWINSSVQDSDNGDQSSNKDCVEYPPEQYGFGDLATKKSDGRSISLNSHRLSTSDPHSLSTSRSTVKSMDATNDNTVNCWPPHATFKGNNKEVKRAFRLRREPSINSQKELNARVESFISTFNEKMKIQRQESLISYMQMVDRSA
ncbi:hypothetical protein GOP47_0017252 [Adiantum capillus-veneris]|uniref:Uncharacterized protein n=1 Tax=Adiantum capillus-veneris TaxID=13818 RepID=A0A9D4UJZ0_ADICA|nr:hypothetical protein GOP47_0017252 [Adiantum capillus-veneris]